MSKKRKLGFLIWATAFALSVFLTLIVPTHYSGNIIATLTFDLIAYTTVLILWFIRFRNNKEPDSAFYDLPAMTLSIVYLAIQSSLSIVVGLMADMISFKITLILNFVLMVVGWFLILSAMIARDHAQSVDSRQKNHHIEL